MRSILLVLVGLAVAQADEVVLANGQRMHGRVLEEDSLGIWLEVPGGKIRLARRDIVEIIVEEEGAGSEAGRIDDLLRAGAWTTAIEEGHAALEKYPDDAPLREKLARAYLGQARRLAGLNRPHEAIETIKQALAECPDSAPLFEESVQTLLATIRGLDKLLERAVGAMERGDFPTAYALFSEAAVRSPLRMESFAGYYAVSMVRLGDDVLGKGLVGDATDLYARALSLDPSLGGALKERLSYTLGLTIADTLRRGEKQEARRQINTLRRDFPTSVVGVFFDASVSRSEGRENRALQLYQGLFKAGHPLAGSRDLDALEESAGNLVAELLGSSLVDQTLLWARTDSEDWEVLEVDHFRIRHRNQEAARAVAVALENALLWVAATMGLGDLPEMIEVVLHPDEAGYQEATGQHEWSGGLTTVACHGGRAVSRRIDLLQTAPQLIDSVVPHELAHVIWLEIQGRHGTPLWLSEGLATMFESSYKLRHFREIFGRLAGIEALPGLRVLIDREAYPDDSSDAGEFYAHSHVVVSYLFGLGGLEKLSDLNERLVKGRPVESSLEAVYGIKGLKWLEKELVRSAE